MMTSQPHQRRGRVPGTGIRWSYVAALVILAALILLVVQNNQQVHFQWLWLDFQASLAVMLLVTVLATMALTSLAGLVWRSRRRHRMTVARDRDSEALHESTARQRSSAARPSP